MNGRELDAGSGPAAAAALRADPLGTPARVVLAAAFSLPALFHHAGWLLEGRLTLSSPGVSLLAATAAMAGLVTVLLCGLRGLSALALFGVFALTTWYVLVRLAAWASARGLLAQALPYSEDLERTLLLALALWVLAAWHVLALRGWVEARRARRTAGAGRAEAAGGRFRADATAALAAAALALCLGVDLGAARLATWGRPGLVPRQIVASATAAAGILAMAALLEVARRLRRPARAPGGAGPEPGEGRLP